MKKLALLVFAVVVVATIGMQASTTPPSTVESKTEITFTSEAPVFTVDGVEVETTCEEDSTDMGPSCENKCEKKRKRCVRQGNGETYCYDNVFCSCMCNTCNNCIC